MSEIKQKCPKCKVKLEYAESPFMNYLGEPEKIGLQCPKCGEIYEEK